MTRDREAAAAVLLLVLFLLGLALWPGDVLRAGAFVGALVLAVIGALSLARLVC